MSRTALLIGTVAGLALAACHENPTETVSDPPRPSFSVAQSKSSPVVNSTTDDGDGTCTDTKCTLRDAIAYADPGATITFAASLTAGGPATIGLTTSTPFEESGLLIAKNLTITGPGADKLTVTRLSDGVFRIFRINAGTVSISGLAITNGRGPGGGGIQNHATLALADCVVSGNRASSITSSYSGGGIHNLGTMTLDRCTVSNNDGVEGGAVLNEGTLVIANSTVSGNHAYSVGGISNFAGGPLTIAHSTITNNASAVFGSAIDGPATVRNSIFAGNRRNQVLDPTSNCSQRASGVITDGGYNIDDGTSCGFTGTGSLQNTDPKLVAAGLTNNGGPTATIALDPTSSAINVIAAGTNGCGSTYTTDQRGFVRPAGTRCDIGSYEFQDDTDPSVTVTTPAHGGSYAQGLFLTADYSCEDPDSGIASCDGTEADGDPVDTSIPGSHSFLVTAVDNFGNSTTRTATYTVIDAMPPTITLLTPTGGATYGLNQVVLANYSCVDLALASCTGTVPNGSPINTASPGSHSFTVTARDDAGNISAPVTRHYTVGGYTFQGFAAPVDNNGTLNVAKAGKAIALKWRLVDGNGSPVTTLASVNLTVENYACGLVETADAIEEYSAGSSGLQNLGNGYYQYNWKALASYANSCKTLMLDLGDGTPRTALFKFTR